MALKGNAVQTNSEIRQDFASVLNWMSEDNAGTPVEKRTTLADLKAMAWRQRRYLLTMLLVALLIGILAVFLMTPKYQANSSVRIDNETIQVIKGDDVNPIISSFDTDRFLNAQKGVFLSRTMAYKVIDRLKLDQTNTFLERMGASVPSDKLSPRAATFDRREAAASLLLANLKMDIPAMDRIAQIKFTAPDPQLAQQVANAYADAFIENNISSRYNATSYARGVLTQQVQEAEARLRETDTAAVNYARVNHLIDTSGISATTDGGGSGTISSSGSIKSTSLMQANIAFGEARRARVLAEQRWRNAQSGSALALPDVRENVFVQSLLGQRATTATELNQLKQTYLDDYPSILQAKGRLVEIDAQINLALKNVRGVLRNEYEIAVNQERQLGQALAIRSNETLDEQNKRVQYNQLLRNSQSQRYRLLELERRLGEVNSLSDIATNNVSLVDHAMRPVSAVSPNLLRSLALALAVGLIVGLAFAILREVIDDTLWSPEDAENKLGRPLLGTTPVAKGFTTHEVISGQGDVSEAYFAVRTAVDYATQGNVRKVLQVTSCQPGEGKSTTSVALAADFARVGRRVFLNEHGFTITIVNIEETELGEGPFKCMVGDACQIDLPDNAFDIVHSNSVIEHVGDAEAVSAFACEVRRLAPAYYLQTPNWWFPVDPHFWKVPFFHWMPKAVRAELLARFRIASAGRVKDRTLAREIVEETRLVTGRQLRDLFPDGAFRKELFGGLTKSWIVTRG